MKHFLDPLLLAFPSPKIPAGKTNPKEFRLSELQEGTGWWLNWLSPGVQEQGPSKSDKIYMTVKSYTKRKIGLDAACNRDPLLFIQEVKV